MATLEESINASITSQYRAVFPSRYNANKTLFGGEALKWMDEVAYITATRFTHKKVFTVKIDNTRFLKPVFPDSVIEVVGKVSKLGNIKIEITVEIFSEDMYSKQKEKVVTGCFIMAALNQDGTPMQVAQTRGLKGVQVDFSTTA